MRSILLANAMISGLVLAAVSGAVAAPINGVAVTPAAPAHNLIQVGGGCGRWHHWSHRFHHCVRD
ncbi:MAG: hypothetical protein ABSA13_08660 [Beijerinckiaceae bacterium]|jgi:hypothetical protein